MSKHTPGPWNHSAGTIRGLNSVLIATMKDHLPINGINQQANAAFIVKAVNCHDELLEALKALVSDNSDLESPSYYLLLKEKARQAILKAEGKQ